jgi:hypothetical protein
MNANKNAEVLQDANLLVSITLLQANVKVHAYSHKMVLKGVESRALAKNQV